VISEGSIETMATKVCVMEVEELTGLSRDAAVYAVEELAHRAGVGRAMLLSWRIEFEGNEFVSVYIQAGTRKRIRFPRAGADVWRQINAGTFQTSTAGWMIGFDRHSDFIPDFRIPFSSSNQEELGPLFQQDLPDTFTCRVDLLLSAVLTLSRFEETLPGARDVHGRFSAYSSIAWQDDFLHRPIVDEYGLALEEVLRVLLPSWRSAVAKSVRYGRPLATFRDLLAPLAGIDTTYQLQLRKLVQMSAERRVDSAIYWKASNPGPYDTGYDPRDKRIQRMIDSFQAQRLEMGIHPSYATFHSPELLRSEVQALRDVLGEVKLGGRQDYLRWSPQTWLDWDRLGLAYDASVGFADQIGFRAGTAVPYRPWLWAQQRKASLVEIPLLAMDSTLQGYMRLSPEKALNRLRELITRCRKIGGVFTLAWHNTRISDSEHASVYKAVLDELSGSAKYDWRSTAL
jgi:hypothetical protein